ncbi:MAG: class I SAM-dependent methyltransferase [Deltaproteobacteria bacterium]|nr:class I SAM-dependent methyltransferase [Deltaproteobacteria bacterium]
MQTKEPQYQIQFNTLEEKGPVRLGPTAGHLYRSDPRHLGFLLARYKFCAKLLSGKSVVLEVGCGDGFGTGVILQEVAYVHGVDFDGLFVNSARELAKNENMNCTFELLDITEHSPQGLFDAAYSLDLIEHIPKEKENKCMENICKVLDKNAPCIIGTPNITSRAHASQWSKEGHINLKSAETLKGLLSEYFQNVFIFSMNDEVVHTGFYPMAHYLMALAVGVKG